MTKRGITSRIIGAAAFTLALAGFVRTARADANFDLWRSDSVCLRMLSFATDIPLLGTMTSSGLSVCGVKDPEALTLTLPGSALGLPGIDLHFSGVRAVDDREVTWSINSAPRSCIMLRDTNGNPRDVFVDTVRGSLTMHYDSLPSPMRDSVDGVPTANLLTVRPGMGANRLEFGVWSGCSGATLGGTVVVRDFMYSGTIAARSALAELTPAPAPPVRRIAGIDLHPQFVCQDRRDRFSVPIHGHVSLSRPAIGPEEIHLSAGLGGSVATKFVTVPSGEYGADFDAEVSSWSEGLVMFYANTLDDSEQQRASVTVSVFDEDIPQSVACGEYDSRSLTFGDFEDNPIYPIPPKDAMDTVRDLMGAFEATIKPPFESPPVDVNEAAQCFEFSDLTVLQTMLESSSIGPQPPLESIKGKPY